MEATTGQVEFLNLILSPRESNLDWCNVAQTFESVDEILQCDHSMLAFFNKLKLYFSFT